MNVLKLLYNKFKFLNRMNKKGIDYDLLFDLSRLLVINDKFDEEYLIKYALAGTISVFEFGGLSYYSNDPKIKFQIMTFPYTVHDGYNIKITILQTNGNKSISYQFMFNGKMDINYLIDNTETVDKNLVVNSIEMIKLSIKNTIYNIKRWY